MAWYTIPNMCSAKQKLYRGIDSLCKKLYGHLTFLRIWINWQIVLGNAQFVDPYPQNCMRLHNLATEVLLSRNSKWDIFRHLTKSNTYFFTTYFFTNNKIVQKSIEKSVWYMLIPILLLKSQHTLHTYSGERNPKILSYNILARSDKKSNATFSPSNYF